LAEFFASFLYSPSIHTSHCLPIALSLSSHTPACLSALTCRALTCSILHLFISISYPATFLIFSIVPLHSFLRACLNCAVLDRAQGTGNSELLSDWPATQNIFPGSKKCYTRSLFQEVA
ncbi:unnamed protein product, partial [Ectocarpus sp. 12 AP-2014]